MKTLSVDKLQIGLVAAAVLVWQVGQPLSTLIWNASAAFTEMRAMKPEVEELKRESKAQRDLMVQFQLTQGKMLQALKDMNKPVIQTKKTVEQMAVQVAKLDDFIGPFRSYYQGPLTMSESN